MKRHLAAQRGRQKLSHAATAISTMNLLAEKLTVDKTSENPSDGDECEKSSVNGDAAASETATDADDPPETDADDGEGIPCVACCMIEKLESMSFDNDEADNNNGVGGGNSDVTSAAAVDDEIREAAVAEQAEADAVAAGDATGAEAAELDKKATIEIGKTDESVGQVEVEAKTEWDEKVNQLMAAGSELEPKPEVVKEVKIRVKKEPRQAKQTRQPKGPRGSRRKPKQ